MFFTDHARTTTIRIAFAALFCGVPRVADGQGPPPVEALVDSLAELVEEAVMRSDTERLRNARVLLDRMLAAHPDDPRLPHYHGYLLFREAAASEALDEQARTEQLLREADHALQKSAEHLPWPETLALRSSVLGRLIAASSNPLAAMTLGPRSSRAMDRALELGPDNPRVWLIRGMNARYTPRMWGGGLERAEEYLARAVQLFESDAPAGVEPRWGRAEAYLWLGNVHRQRKELDQARAAYERAIQLAPDYQAARRQLAALSQTQRK